MKKFLLLTMCMLFTHSVLAYDVLINGVYYYLDNQNGTAIVASGDEPNSYSGIVNIPDYITTDDGVKYEVVGIGGGAFYDCPDLTNVIIAAKIKTVWGGAFNGCSSLKSIALPDVTSIDDGTFIECKSLESVYLPNATAIGKYAFLSCSSLKVISLPNATTIGESAFSCCFSLTSVDLPSATTIGESAFSSCTALTSVDLSSVTSIGKEAFFLCLNISSLRIGSVEQWCSVQLPSSNAYYASPLYQSSKSVDLYIGDSETPATSIEVPSTVTAIPDYAFCRTTITSVSAPAATSIGSSAFFNCTSLASISLPAVTSIGSEAFWNCSNISSLRIGSVEQWCSVQLPSNAYNASPLCQSSESVDLYIGDSETPVTSLEVPSTVTEIPIYAFRRTTITSVSAPAAASIGGSAFYNCTSLTSISLPAVTSIGSEAFYYCSNISSLRIGSVEQWCSVQLPSRNAYNASPLYQSSKSVDLYIGDSETPATSIEVPSTVTAIPDYAFLRTTITSVSAPAATSIGSYAFYDCTSLASVSLPAVTSIGSYAFWNCSNISSLRIGSVEQWCSVQLPSSDAYYASPLYQSSKSVDLYIGDSETPATSIEVPSTVTAIPDYAFRRTTITSVSAPAATSIGSSAFCYCSALTSVALPAATSIGSSAFYYCSALTSVALPAATSIGAKAFSECYALNTIHLETTTPPAATNTNSFPTWTMLAVPEEAYETYLAADVYKEIPLQITVDGHLDMDVEVTAANGTSNLLEKIGEDEVKYVVNLKVSGTINSYDMLIIRNQMTSLRNLDLTDASIVDCDYIYSNANGTNYHSQKDVITGDWLKNVMNVKLPTNIKTIGSRAFYNNSRLQTVNIPDGVTSIGSEAFYSCNRIKELTLPQSVTSFGSNAFYYCTGLREVVIPDGVTSIGYQAFRYCTDLKKVTIPASVTSIGSGAFYQNTLELHINDLESWLNIQMGDSSPFTNVAKLYIGDSLEPTEDLIIPEGTSQIKNCAFTGFKCLKSVTFPTETTSIGSRAFYNSGITDINFSDNISSIGSYAFYGCTGLKTLKLPEKLTTINSYAFQSCSNLETIAFADNVTTIGEYAFSGCSKLTKLELPAYLKTIGKYAFESCSNLTEVVIPASITNIADYAFSGCSKMNTVIATTVEPIRINQNTFSTYKTATLYSPKTSYYKYYWNTQYNQFLQRKEYDKEFAKVFGYKYFYLNGQNGDNSEDFVISDETGPIQGVDDKAPDADFYEGAGLVVGGEQVQNLGDIHLHHNGNNGASIIAKQSGKVHIDNLYVDIKTQKNRWYFFCFPFDVNTEDATFDGSHVWYLYDGETRAQNGNGGWKKTAVDGVMKAGYGYIFQGAQNGTLTIHVSDLTIDTSDSKTNMITYASDNKNDASWNLIGNPSVAYYDMDNLDYEAPITLYNNETGNYEAVRPGDDQYEFYPFQAFFVQKPEDVDALSFEADKKETKNMADKKKAAASGAKASKAKANSQRKVINLEMAAVDEANDSVAAPTDRTRVVVNPMKTTAYEPECDAAKFIADNMPQIYSLDNEGNRYAINERPVEDGIIALAVKADKDGIYTISATRLDCAAKLRDLEAETEVDLAEGAYTFTAEAKTYTDRFQLILANVSTGITTPEEAKAAVSVEAGAISIGDGNADVKVYSVGGSLVAAQKGAGTISVPAGTYVVNVNGQSVKVNVNE